MVERESDGEDAASLLSKLFLRRANIKKELKRTEKEIFKHETVLLEVSQGNTITKSLEYYSSNRSERRKYNIRDSDRIFSKDLPPIGEQ